LSIVVGIGVLSIDFSTLAAFWFLVAGAFCSDWMVAGKRRLVVGLFEVADINTIANRGTTKRAAHSYIGTNRNAFSTAELAER
jgi:hypothetical protein